METEILTGEDIRFLAQQPDAEVGIMLGQMTTLMQNINDLQQDTDDKVAKLESQGWFKRMVNTLFGRNKATKQEIQKNNDKVVTYISQSVAQLYQMNMINERIICSLGNRMNEVYMQVTNMYQEQLNMKAQISQIMAVQQQTLETMGAFVSKLNEKIESVDNFHMLISEIQNGMYSDSSRLYNMCSILSQLDKRQMDDSRKMNLLRDTMERAGVISQEEFTVQKCLQEIVALPTEKIGLIYMELCNFRQSFPANLFADMIESYHFLSKMERMSKKKELIIQRVMDAYELDANASFSVADIADSFFENKQGCLVTLGNVPQITMQADESTPQSKMIFTQNNGANFSANYDQDEATTPQSTTIPNQNAQSNSENSSVDYDQNKVDGLIENGDYRSALVIVGRAAVNGNADAQRTLGFLFTNGWGVNKDESKAFSWYQKAAEQGLDDAQYRLGCCYYYGIGIDTDYSEGANWFKKAAEQGHDEAQEMLGTCYYTGLGVAEDFKEAVKWFRKAAEQGNADAQYALGRAYHEGQGVDYNYTEAVKWLKKAAEQGQSAAIYRLEDLE